MSIYVGPRDRADTRGVCKSEVIVQHGSSKSLSENYVQLKQLGSGAFGKVNLVRDKTFKQERVCKVVSTKGMSRPVLDAMKKEIELLRTLDHPSIVRLYEFAEDPLAQELTLILEYISGGDCHDLVKNSAVPLEEKLVAHFLYQLLKALAYCHLRGVVHRDVKPNNMMVLYSSDGGEPDLKLIDFGLSELGSPEMRDYVGSPLYMAPEIHRHATYTLKADIWSAGISALELLAGEPRFPHPHAQTIGRCRGFDELVGHLAGNTAWEARGPQARDFLRTLCQVEASLRPGADAAAEHPWLQAHRPATRKFPRAIARSLSAYARAPAVVRCCLLSIAARVGDPDLQTLGHAFLSADTNGNGLLSHEDLEDALDNVDGLEWWHCDFPVRVNVGELLRAGDLSHHGGLNFTEFVAACLCTKYGAPEVFATRAFLALDSNRTGLVRVDEIRGLFRERDQPFLNTLPQDRPFGLAEWRKCVESYSPESDESSSEEGSSDSLEQPKSRWWGLVSCMR